MYQTFLNGLWSSVSSMIDLLRSSEIGDYMFNGLSLWIILITFFAGGLLIKFFISSFRGGSSGHSFLSGSGSSPQNPHKGVNDRG